MKPLVVLLHGLARGQGSMAKLGAYLRTRGFDTPHCPELDRIIPPPPAD